MDRKSQILAPTSKVGGVRRAYKPAAPKAANLKATLDTFKGEISPTVLETCSYKIGENIITYENAKIQSITSKGKKHVCFLVTGRPTTINENEALSNMPKEVESTIRNITRDSVIDGESHLESEVPE